MDSGVGIFFLLVNFRRVDHAFLWFFLFFRSYHFFHFFGCAVILVAVISGGFSQLVSHFSSFWTFFFSLLLSSF